MRKRRAGAVLAAVTVAITMAATSGASAAKPTTPGGTVTHNATVTTSTIVGSYPTVAAHRESGRLIGDLAEHDGKLFAAHGDYGANTGPVIIEGYDLATGEFTGPLLSAPTEEIEVFRNIRGNLYGPLADPKFGWTEDSGYATTKGGTWSTFRGVGTPMIHTFDITAHGDNGLVMVGSALDDNGVNSAVAYHSPDDGATWARISLEPNGTENDVSRYYWAAEAGGKVYFQAEHLSGSKLKSFDGRRVQTLNYRGGYGGRLCWTTDASQVVSFNDRIVCTTPGGVLTFDGKGDVRTMTYDASVTDTGYGVSDFHVSDDGWLYAASGPFLLRSLDGYAWERFVHVPDSPNMWSVYVTGDGDMYAAGYGPDLYRVDVNAHDIPTVLTAPAGTGPVDDGKVWNPNKPVK